MTEKLRYVGFWARVLASLIDSVLVMLLLMPFSSFIKQDDLVYAENFRFGDDMENQIVQAVIMAVVVVIFWIYRSATPGKMILGMRIVDARTGGKPSNSQLIIRYLGYYVSLLPFGFGFLWIAFDDKKQGFHDKLAKTLVVR